MENVIDGEYAIYIYDEIKPDRVNYDGEIIPSKTDANKIREQIESIPNNSKINVYISSNGGDVKTGLAIYSILSRKQADKTAYIDGFACSIASVIPMACNKIIMYPTSLMMIHNASGGFYGNAEEHRKFADDLDTISSSAVTAYLTKAGDKLNRETLDTLLNGETWLSASDCFKYGLCDEIAEPKTSDDTTTKMGSNTSFNMYRKLSEIMFNGFIKSGTDTVADTDDNADDKGNEEITVTDEKDDNVEMEKGSTSDVDDTKDDNNFDLNNCIDVFVNSIFNLKF